MIVSPALKCMRENNLARSAALAGPWGRAPGAPSDLEKRNPGVSPQAIDLEAPGRQRPAPSRASRALWFATAALVLGLARPALAQEQPPAPEAAGAPSAVLIQESNGFPGGEQKSAEPSRQEVWIQGDRLRILDHDNGYGMFIDLELKQVLETDFVRKIYYERPFSYYEKYRREREQALADQKKEFVRGAERLSGKELEAWRAEYRKIGGDPDQPGRLQAKLEHIAADRKTIEILVDREPRQVTLEHYKIRENRAELPIFDVWTTTDVALSADLFRFYRAVGTFSAPVTEALIGLKGTIVSCDVVLDAGSFHRMFKSSVQDVRAGRAAGSVRFEVEKMRALGWRTEEEHKAQLADEEAKRRAALPKPTCASCGKEIGEQRITFKSPWGREIYLLDSPACRAALVKKLIAERKKK